MKYSNFFKKYSLIIFFSLGYLIMITGVLIRLITPILMPELLFWFITYWSPTISAILVSGFIGGWEEIKRLLSGFLKWRVSSKWYLASFLIVIAPLIFAGFYILLGGQSQGLAPGITIPILLFNLLYTFLSGPVSEEAGWRGFALPRLQSRFNALVSSLILGIIWACWHLPLYLIEPRIAFYIFVPLVLVISILMTWIYNNTGGSLLLTIMMHFSFNFDMAFIVGYLGLMPEMVFYIGSSIMIGIYLIFVIIYAGAKNLSRKPDSEMPFLRLEKTPKKLINDTK